MAAKKTTRRMIGGTLRPGHVPNPTDVTARAIFVNPGVPANARTRNAWREEPMAPGHAAAAYTRWAEHYAAKGERGKARKTRAKAKKAKALYKARAKNPQEEEEMKRSPNPRSRRGKRKSRRRKSRKRRTTKRRTSKRRSRRRNPAETSTFLTRIKNPSKERGVQALVGVLKRVGSVGAGYMFPRLLNHATMGWLHKTVAGWWSKSKDPGGMANIAIDVGGGLIHYGGVSLIQMWTGRKWSDNLQAYKLDAAAGTVIRLIQDTTKIASKGDSKFQQGLRDVIGVSAPAGMNQAMYDAALAKTKLVQKEGGAWKDINGDAVTIAKRADGVLVDKATGQILVNALTGKRLINPAKEANVSGYINAQPVTHQRTTAGYIDARPAHQMGTTAGYINAHEVNPPQSGNALYYASRTPPGDLGAAMSRNPFKRSNSRRGIM